MRFQFHIISGLPRSGSTLLSALLSQNPAFHASISSPVFPMIASIRDTFNHVDRFAESMVSESEQIALYRDLIQSYYQSRISKPCKIVFDTNRTWTKDLSLLAAIAEPAKVIVCVRNMADILNSFEWQFRRSPLIFPNFFTDASQWGSVYSRVDTMIHRNGAVGAPWIFLKEGFYSQHSQRLLIVDYDLLVSCTLKVLECIYQFLELPYWTGHSLKGIALKPDEQTRVEKFDQVLGAPDLHRLQSEVQKIPREMLIPPELIQTLDQLNFWRSTEGSKAFCLTQDS